MQPIEVLALLKSLWDRIEPTAESGKLRLDGVISTAEVEALREAIEIVGRVSRTSEKRDPQIAGSGERARIALDAACLSVGEAANHNAALCLDFGTAMSKAFAIVDGVPIGLSLGKEAGYSESEFAVPSSIYISDDGRIYFGHEAIARSDEDAGKGSCTRMRLDSPKQQLSQGEIGDLGNCLPNREINPTSVRLSYEDLITLYLAYISNLASSQLAMHGVSPNIARRIARPCWDEARTSWADKLLSKMCVAGQILGDSLRGKWANGALDVASARSLLDQVHAEVAGKDIPHWLQATGVPEPMAAGFGRVFRGEPERRAFMVIDVGAGTTDFGLFVMAFLPQKAQPTVALARRSTFSLRQAGDRVDAILRLKLLAKHGVDPTGGEEGRLIGLHLNRQIRRWKESLFRDKSLSYRLSNDISGEITLEEFERDDHVRQFVDAMAVEFVARLNHVHVSWISNCAARQPLQVVLTGGASSMPMLRELASNKVQAHGLDVVVTESAEFPEWITNEHPEFAGAYRQLAVAIGGAAPDLPKRLVEFETFGGGGPQGPWQIERFQTRGT